MSCLNLDVIERYAAGALSESERTPAQAHFVSCERCREQLAQAQDTLRAAEQIARARAEAVEMDAAAMAPVGDAAATESVESPVRISPGARISGYDIVRELSRGGQGVVYQAVQKSTKRKVAVKVLLEGPFASASGRKRFEREIDLVAQLQHANIVTIFDSGTTSGGQLFFAMDYIRGTPLHHYVRENKLTLEQTLKLFGLVCEAVQYAHQKGVIHRDLKPTNVLVDAEGVPRVLDFGLAKQMAAPVETVMSVTGQVVGTLPYMSPEQARGSPDHIDTRTDVYALGVILYELLTGHYPYQVVGNLEDVLRNIRQTAPTPPSRSWRAGTGVDARSDRRRRGRCPIDEEVETIVMKCLAKERERRYQSAGELGKDLAHYLADEPVEARRDSGWYVLKKTLRRHRAAVGVTAAIMVLVSFSTIALSIMYRSQQRATRVAIGERDAARQAREAEAEQRAEAGRQRDAAVAAQTRADERRREAEFQAYISNIGAADAALAADDYPSALARLARCAPESRNWEWRHLKSRADLALATLRGHTAGLSSVVFSPDGQRLASAGNGALKLWDATSGAEVRTLYASTLSVFSVAFSPDGRRLACTGQDNTVKLWDATSGAQLLTLRGHAGWVMSATFSPDGQRLASASLDNSVKLWNAASGAELLTLCGHTDGVSSVAFSPDGQRLGSASRDQTVKLWDAASGAELATLRGHTNWVDSVVFSPDGQRVASASRDKTVKLWDAAGGAEILTLRGHRNGVMGVAFSPDGQHVASASMDSTIRLWDAASGAELLTLRGHWSWAHSVAFSPDGRRLASAAEDKTVRLWDVAGRHEPLTLRGVKLSTRAVALSPDGQRLASGQEKGTVKVWDAVDGAELLTLRGHTAQVLSVSFSPDGQRLASASSDKTVKLWEVGRGSQLLTLGGHTAMVYWVAFSPDGQRLASASEDKTVKLWDTASGAEVLTLRGHTGPVYSVDFSPDGQRLATVSGDKTLRLWDAANGAELMTLRGHTLWLSSVAFSPDGLRVAAASGDHTVRLWDAASGAALLTLHGHAGSVYSIAFTPDGRRLVSASNDDTVKLWDTASGAEVLTLRGHTGPVYSVALSQDGERLASYSQDETVKLWDTLPRSVRGAAPAWPVVDALFARLGSANAVVDHIRRDASLTAEFRTVAEKVVLVRASAFGEEAFGIVQRLFDELPSSGDVIDRLQKDSALSKPVRNIALNMARAWGDDPDRWDARSWPIVSAAGADAERYRMALHWAETAHRLSPDDGMILNTLGVAQYRVGEYAKTLEALTRSDQLNRASSAGPQPTDAAFLAMSLHRLNRVDEARVALARLRELMKDSEHANNTEFQQFLHEAEALIEGRVNPNSQSQPKAPMTGSPGG